MEEKINIAEILKNKPKGTKLYADAFGELSIEDIDIYAEGKDELGITLSSKDEDELLFYNNGKYNIYGEPILVPSKSMRDWGKFAWKKGDVLVNKDGNVHIIFDGFEDDTYKKFHGKNYLWEEGGSIVNFEEDEDYMQTSDFNKANKEDAQEYIHKIEKELGGKLNMETLEVEKSQPEFKDGDIVVYGKSVAICRKIYKHTLCFYVSLNEMFGLLFDDEVESSEEYRFATEEEKQQLFDSLAKEGIAWDAEKKQIVDLPKKCEFKAFDKVLVRDSNDSKWKAGFFSHYSESLYYPFICVGGGYGQCIPYNDQTKHLLGTTDEWKEGEG